MAEDGVIYTKQKLWSRLIIALVVVALLVAVAFFYHKYKTAVAANPATQQNSIISQVDSLAVTPSEQPQVAMVKDAAKLTSGVLAEKAENGDAILVYNKSDFIILYRPSERKIVDMLTVQAPTTASQTTKKAS